MLPNIVAKQRAPSKTEVDKFSTQIADESGGQVDVLIAKLTPTGDYTSDRLKSLASVLSEMLSQIDPELADLPAMKVSGRSQPLPKPLVERYLSARDATDAYIAETGAQVQPLPDILTLVNDNEILMAATAITALLEDPAFVAWLKAQADTEDEMTAEVPVAAAPANEELALLQEVMRG